MVKSFISAVAVGVTALLSSFPLPALAVPNSFYTFNKYIGTIHVGRANIYQNNVGGVTVTAPVQLGTCGRFHFLGGSISFSFTSEDGGYFRNYRYYVKRSQEGDYIQAWANVPHYMSSKGRLTIVDETYCSPFN